ncbi:MAG: cellulose 1,4-beta-cellobiosidase [Ruminococcus sp.]|nr:cellulose 1,4-beta-cellobiosidase [Ruminococcus sp.]
MLSKKRKAMISAVVSAAVLTSTVLPMAASATRRTEPEAFGDETYAQRFLSLYDDVITNGQTNGYLSDTTVASGGFGVPYHAVETCIVEAPDYGHETTSEAMSYIVWMAAMRDNIGANSDYAENTGDLAKAWKTMEVMIPTSQTGFWGKTDLSAQVADEDVEDITSYPQPGDASNTGANPIHKYFTSAYSSDKGEYLMHWLADVDDWYGFGGAYRSDLNSEPSTTTPSDSGTFTFINTFQRGNQESCFETIPHPCIEDLKFGNTQKGMKGCFSTDSQVAAQWSYTNAPDAEDRAIQAIYAAKLWGVGSSDLYTKAGKMGDQLRNNMFDKYYKAIGCQNKQSGSAGYDSAHYLMSWYTAWGGAKDGSWAWQIGCSHSHQFYQNPLAAYALAYDSDLNGAMEAEGATKDYVTSLQRQLELYLWLQSADGPFAGGCTNSWDGKYASYPSSVSTFYNMAYTEHPVYADPGSNHWIGNQVWSTQRLAELYYYIKTNGDASNGAVKPGGMTIEEALKTLLDRWVAWFVENTQLTEDGDYAIPATLDWSGQPAKWEGTYSATANSGLTCSIRNYGSSDLGCVASLANTLIYYAKAENTAASDMSADASTLGGQALYLAQQLLDRSWEHGRDNIGVSRPETNGSLSRIFEQELWVPSGVSMEMPYGDIVEPGVTFIDIRSMYLQDEKCMELKEAFETTGSTESVELNYHRFWHAGDYLLALGAMYELYPEITPDSTPVPTKTLYGDVDVDGDVDVVDLVLLSRYVSQDQTLAAGTVTAQGKINADVDINNEIGADDISGIALYLAGMGELPLK